MGASLLPASSDHETPTSTRAQTSRSRPGMRAGQHGGQSTNDCLSDDPATSRSPSQLGPVCWRPGGPSRPLNTQATLFLERGHLSGTVAGLREPQRRIIDS